MGGGGWMRRMTFFLGGNVDMHEDISAMAWEEKRRARER